MRPPCRRMTHEGPAQAGYSIGGAKREGTTMNENTKISKTLRTALVCAGLATAGAVWAEDCNISAGQMEAAASGESQADILTDVEPVSRIDPELYGYLHNAEMHRADGLGQDFGNFATAVDRH